jgi:hypothetical protein
MKTLYLAASFTVFAWLLGGCGTGVMPAPRLVAPQQTHAHHLRPATCPTDSGGIMTGC